MIGCWRSSNSITLALRYVSPAAGFAMSNPEVEAFGNFKDAPVRHGDRFCEFKIRRVLPNQSYSYYGTAEEDAFRRDLMINSLFYNISTNEVEDFTRRGIADLNSGKIVTPLPPKQTLLDDPLRVLHAVRFTNFFALILLLYTF